MKLPARLLFDVLTIALCVSLLILCHRLCPL